MLAERIRKESQNSFTTSMLYFVKAKIKKKLFSLSNGTIFGETKRTNSEISCVHHNHTDDPLSCSPTFLTITSSGPSADLNGDHLGLYEVRGTHNSSHYYRQVDTVRRDGGEFFVYRCKNGNWAMGPGLDGPVSIWNQNKTDIVPLTGWECYHNGVHIDDPLLKISSGLPLPCGDITIRGSRSAEFMQPRSIGVYTPTKMFSGGRRVFKHVSQERYILSQPDCMNWYVQDSVDEKGPYMSSGSAPSMCPADPRARTNPSVGLSSWNYWANWGVYLLEDPLITVTCSVHSY